MLKKFLTLITTVFIILAVNEKAISQENPDSNLLNELFFINECKAYSISLLRSVGVSQNTLRLINPESRDLIALGSIEQILSSEFQTLIAIEQRLVQEANTKGMNLQAIAQEIGLRNSAITEPIHNSKKTVENKDMKHLYLLSYYLEKNGPCINYIQTKLEEFSSPAQ